MHVRELYEVPFDIVMVHPLKVFFYERNKFRFEESTEEIK